MKNSHILEYFLHLFSFLRIKMCLFPNLAAEIDHEDGEEEATGDDDQPQHVGHDAAGPSD